MRRLRRLALRCLVLLIIAGCAAAITMLMWLPMTSILQALLVLGLFAVAAATAVLADQLNR